MSNNLKKTIIAILILAIIGLSFYSYNNNKKHASIEKEMLIEKNNLLDDLSKLESQYDDAISKNTSLSKELITQKESIKAFKDSLKKIKKNNWKLINFYKNKIKALNDISNKLVRTNDSLAEVNKLLNIENQDLTQQKDSLTTNLQQQTTYNNTLSEQNLDLTKKVSLGEIVKANNFSVVTYKEKSGGKYKETDKARRVDVFKTSFVLNENPIAKESDIVSYVVITKPDGELLVNKGTFTTKTGERVDYSDTSTIPYKKVAITSDILIKFGDTKLLKGTYLIDFYINDTKVGSIQKNLR